MKTFKRVLAVVLSAVLCLSVFSVVPSAKELDFTEPILREYEKRLTKTVQKGLVKTEIEEKHIGNADYGLLCEIDEKLTRLRDKDKYDGMEKERAEYTRYFDGKKVSEETGVNEIYENFSVEYFAKANSLIFDSAVTGLGNHGYVNYYFDFHDEESSVKWHFQIVIKDYSGLIKYFRVVKSVPTDEKSAFLKNYNPTEREFTEYEFTYNEVPVKSISLSRHDVILTYKDTVEFTVKIGPENASFNDFYYTLQYNGSDEVYTEKVYNTIKGVSTIKVMATGKGTAELRVYTMDSKFYDSCKFTIEFSPLDYVRFFFDKAVDILKTLNTKFS